MGVGGVSGVVCMCVGGAVGYHRRAEFGKVTAEGEKLLSRF